jgi:hypothetical protein
VNNANSPDVPRHLHQRGIYVRHDGGYDILPLMCCPGEELLVSSFRLTGIFL